jgi:hypothetical protein
MFDAWIYFILAVTVLGDEQWQHVLLRVPHSIPSLTPCIIPSCSLHVLVTIPAKLHYR